MNTSKGVGGIRGWLLLFVLWAAGQLVLYFRSFMGMLPIAGANDITPVFFPSSEAVALYLVLFVVIAFGIVLIFRRSPSTPAYWTSVLLLIVPATFADYVLVYDVARAIQGSVAAETHLQSAVGWVWLRMLLSLAWAAYWLRSKRVLAAFGSRGLRRVRRQVGES